MVKLDVPVWNRLVARLADLAITPNHFEHHFLGYGATCTPALFGFSEGLCSEEDRTDVTEYVTGELGRIELANELPLIGFGPQVPLDFVENIELRTKAAPEQLLPRITMHRLHSRLREVIGSQGEVLD